MDEQKPSTGGKDIPADWVIYRPDEPLYDILHTCTCLSELRDLAEQESEAGSKTDAESQGKSATIPQKSEQ